MKRERDSNVSRDSRRGPPGPQGPIFYFISKQMGISSQRSSSRVVHARDPMFFRQICNSRLLLQQIEA